MSQSRSGAELGDEFLCSGSLPGSVTLPGFYRNLKICSVCSAGPYSPHLSSVGGTALMRGDPWEAGILTCISDTGPAWMGTGWLVSPIKERGKEELSFKICTKQPARLSTFLHKRQRERRKTELFSPSLEKQQIASEVWWRMKGQLKDSSQAP